MVRKVNLAVLASGSGSNLAAIIDAVNENIITNAQISLVVSNKQDAYALNRAETAGIPTLYIKRSEFESNEDFDRHLVERLKASDVDFILLAGYLRILTTPLLQTYENRILNIHPSLLPDFGGVGMYGMRVHEAVIESKAPKSGCTVHLVNEQVDGGPVLAQVSVPVSPEDSPNSLAAKVLKEEHKLYPATVEKYISNFKF